MTRVDAHHHLWDRTLDGFDYQWQDNPDLTPIRRNFLPDDLQPLIQQAKVDQTVLVQTQHHVQENRWALELADTHSWIAGVVGWVDLASDQCEQQLLEFKEHPRFVGIRHVVQDEPDDDFIVRPDVVRGLNVLQRHQVPFDLLFYAKHLRHAAPLAAQLPDLPLVIDHLSKPLVKAGEIDEWRLQIRQAAQLDNVYCKLSGLVTEADWNAWSVEDFRPYVDTIIDCFGPDRIMFGSDWPVCNLAADYATVHSIAGDLISTLSPCEQQAIMGGTAIRFYSLEPPQES